MDHITPSSYLPEPVIQSILKLLPPKDAIRASLTSKLWRSAWITSPLFEFNERTLPFKHVDFYDYAERSLAFWRDHCDDRVNMEKLSLCSDIGADGIFFPRFIQLISIATNRNVKILELQNCSENSHVILSDNSLWPLLSACKSLDVLSMKCFELFLETSLPVISSVKKLRLSCIGIDQRSLRNLLCSLPLLEELVVGFCFRFTELHVSCPKLKIMEATMFSDDTAQNVVIDAVNLQSFTYNRSFNSRGSVRFLNCKLLKSMQIERTEFATANEFEECLSQIPFLENLKLRDCQMREGVQISHSNLKSLELRHCFRLRKAEFNTPNLQYFKYSGPIITFSKFRYCSGFLNAELELFTGSLDDTDWFWFIKLRNFLEIFSDCEMLSLTIHIEGFPDELRNNDMHPDQFYELRHLNISSWKFPVSHHADFLNAMVEIFPCVETLSMKTSNCDISIKFDEDRDFTLNWSPYISASNRDEYDREFEHIKETVDKIVNSLSWTEENYSEQENSANEYSDMDVKG